MASGVEHRLATDETLLAVKTAIEGLPSSTQQAADNANAAATAANNAVANLGGLVADTYSSSTYSVGDYVYYDSKLYRCADTITTAEAWTPSHWVQVALGDDVDNLKSTLNFNLGNDNLTFNYNQYIETGVDVGETVSFVVWNHQSFDYAIADCQEGDTFTISGTGGGSCRLWAFIDNSNKLISKANAYATETNKILTAPENSSKIIICVQKNGIAVKGNTVDKRVSDIKGRVSDIEGKVPSLINYVELIGKGVKDYYSGSTRTEVDYYVSQKFNVTGSKYAKINMAPDVYRNIYTFLDKDGGVIQYKGSNTAEDFQTFEVIVPDDAVTLYVSTTINLNDVKVSISGGKYIDDKIEKLTHLESQILPRNLVLGWFNGTTKVTTYGYSALYRVYDLESVTIQMWPRGEYYNSFTFTDEKDNILYKVQSASSFSEPVTYENVAIPKGATRLYVTDKFVNQSNACETITVYGNLSKYINDFRGNNNYFIGKKVVWYGTSIPAAGYISRGNTWGYPYRVGRLLGADVVNESVGSSCIHCKNASMISVENPYGFNGNYTKCSECLSNTIEEMQWIIDNWNSDIWLYNKRSSAPDATLQAEILSFSYENRIGQYLSEGNEPDFWIFDHGKNDAPDDGTYDPTHPYDLYSTRGAFNFLIKYILDYNPKARILMIGHYENQLYPSVAQIQTAVANDWLIPLMPLWEYFGWSQRVINTTGAWVDGYWDDDAVPAGHEMTLLNIALPDNLHPHSDLTGNTLEFEARHIARWLLNYCGFPQ